MTKVYRKASHSVASAEDITEHSNLSLEAAKPGKKPAPSSCKGPWFVVNSYNEDDSSCSSDGLHMTQYWHPNTCFLLKATGHYSKFFMNSTTHAYQQSVYSSAGCTGSPLYSFPTSTTCSQHGSYYYKDTETKCLPIGKAHLVVGYFLPNSLSFDSGVVYAIPPPKRSRRQGEWIQCWH